MKVLQQDRKQNLIKLRPDNLDDLWHLHHLIEAGDLARAFTHRREEAQQDKIRADRGEKKGMVLGIRVEEMEFHEFSNRLRVTGVIEEGPQEHGAHHTLNVEERTEITVVKPQGWRDHQLERIQQAVEAADRPRVTFVAIENDEATLAVLRQYGVHEVATIAGPTGGKQYEGRAGTKEEFFGEVLAKVEQTLPEKGPLIIVGPGFAKEEFLDFAKQRQSPAAKRALVEGTGQAGMTGVQEAMKRGLVERVAKDARVAVETRMVEDLFAEIAKDSGLATYGPDHVQRALEVGAVEALIVTDLAVREGGGEAWLEQAKHVGAEGHIISTGHEAGEKLQALGGAAARLRYRLPQ